MNESIESPASERASWFGIAAGYTLAMLTWVAVVVIVFRQSLT